MPASLVLENPDGTPLVQGLFPTVHLDRPSSVERTIYVRNAGDKLAYQVVVSVTGGLQIGGEMSKPLGNLEAGERSSVTITRPASPARGNQASTILVRAIGIT